MVIKIVKDPVFKYGTLVIVLVLSGVLTGCPRDYAPYVADAPVRVACVGDSITYGFLMPCRQDNCYPAQLNQLLGNDYGVANFGVNGATVLRNGNNPYYLHDAYDEALAFEPHIVIISLGTNDTMVDNWSFIDSYVADYTALIAAFAALETAPAIYVCYPTPAFVESFLFSGQRIREVILPMIDDVVAQNQVQFIDLHTPLRERPRLFWDGVHPTVQGAGAIAQIVYDAIVADDAL